LPAPGKVPGIAARRCDDGPVTCARTAGLALLGLAGLLPAACSAAPAHPAATTAAATASSAPAARSSSPVPAASRSQPESARIPAGLAYGRYANPRFGFSTLWPAALRAQSPPADGDGQAWRSADGRVTMSAYGANNTSGYSPRRDESADSRGLTVTYRQVSGDIVTVSGLFGDGATIVYQRDVVGRGSIDTLQWTYPASQKARWDAAVTRTAHGFVPGDVRLAH